MSTPILHDHVAIPDTRGYCYTLAGTTPTIQGRVLLDPTFTEKTILLRPRARTITTKTVRAIIVPKLEHLTLADVRLISGTHSGQDLHLHEHRNGAWRRTTGPYAE